MRRLVKRVGIGVVALVVASLGLSGVPAIAATESPDTWDPRVTKYVRFVEQHRKLEFDHPVPVEFLDDDAFVKAYRRDDPKVTKRDRAEAERAAGQLRALGLVAGPVDLIDAERDLGATTTVGFYDQERKQLSVRGTDLTDVDVRVTLVHELTHALQDQRFDLSELDDTVDTSGADFALTALVEGDATSVEDDYLFSLPQADRDAYFAEDPDASSVEQPSIDEDAPSDIPPVLDLFMSGPYIFGPRYIAFLRDAGGMDRVDRGFTHPPRTEEEIIDPVAARRAGAVVRVATPKLQRGEHRRGEPYDFGALSLHLVLASRIDPQVALRAAEGWGGDAAVGFTKRGAEDQQCVRVAFAGDTDVDTAQIADALAQWTAALPAGAATSKRVGDRVQLTACDTGTTAAPDEEMLDAAVTLLVDRNDLALELLGAELPPGVTRCAADRLAADPALVALLGLDEFTDAQQDTFSDRVSSAVLACRR